MHQENKTQKFTFGKAVFQNLSEQHKEKIKNNQEIQSTLQGNYWKINYGEFQQHNWQELFKYMIECKAQRISLYQSNRPQIISQIQYPQAVNLKQLGLGYNKIKNIQPLNFIYFECLQHLFLDCNEISQIKSIKKFSAPFLDNIQIHSNPLIQVNGLTKSKLKKFGCLFLQYLQDQNSIHQDLSAFVKLQSKQIKHLCCFQFIQDIRSFKRIQQNKIKNMLQLRFPFLNTQKKY